MAKPTVKELYAVADGIACPNPDCLRPYSQEALARGRCPCGRAVRMYAPDRARTNALRIALMSGCSFDP